MLNIIAQSIGMSIDNIRSNKMRSFLTMLGIVIGVASVIGLITIVQGATGSVMEEFSNLGAGTLSVSVSGTALKRGLSEKDVDELRSVTGVEGVAPSASATVSAVYNGEIFKNVTMDGKDILYMGQNVKNIISGRGFNEAETDGFTNVCIVDKNFVKKILNGADPIGREVTLNGVKYTVIGVMSDSTSLSGGFTDTSNLDGTATVPYRNILRMNGSGNRISSLEIYIEEGYESSTVETNVRSALKKMFNGAENSFFVFNMDSLMSALDSVSNMMSGLLGGIASIALLVGGIGIMNMMLVSVSERTKEIGLRKALGAEPVRIQVQFLIESITLSLVGGIIGIILGILIAYAGSKLMDTAFSISGSAILIGAGFSAAVGIIFGWMPAKRASELNPIDALRAE